MRLELAGQAGQDKAPVLSLSASRAKDRMNRGLCLCRCIALHRWRCLSANDEGNSRNPSSPQG